MLNYQRVTLSYWCYKPTYSWICLVQTGNQSLIENILCWSKSHNFCVIKFWKMSVFGKLPSSNHHWTAYGSKLSCHFLHNLQFFTVNPRKESILYPPQALTRNRSQRSSDRPKACWSQEMPTCLRRRHKEGCKRDYLPVYPIPSHPIPFHPSIYLSIFLSIHPSIYHISIYLSQCLWLNIWFIPG